VKVWINAGDIILIGLRDYQDTKADVILKYNSDEARNLKAYGELPENGETTLAIIHVSVMHCCFGEFMNTKESRELWLVVGWLVTSCWTN